MDKKMKQTLDRCAFDTMEELKASVEDHMYSWSPKKYKRTKMFLESISKTKAEKDGGTYVCRVYFDADKIEAVIRMPNEWNAHASFSGEPVAEGIIYWMEYGNASEDGTPNPYYEHEGYGFIRDTREWLQYELDNLFKKNAKRLGVPIK